jgi:hypothetical protein
MILVFLVAFTRENDALFAFLTTGPRNFSSPLNRVNENFFQNDNRNSGEIDPSQPIERILE